MAVLITLPMDESLLQIFGGSVANYSCDQGFVLCGAKSRTCQSNETWSGSPPECLSMLNAFLAY